ncbi:hypothetical protein L2102_18905 [Citrobacter portucalensis]|uniref:Ead/Ea22-like family protein n=1 Tax=Citrobacter portucalensis TaxID=1639133 RepID=A0AAJ1JWT6_9ENTR|nr:hypothetical protein [Citrobacter portucalensis]MDE9625388.1 hypothetical protein [Citrobacter portucalensis]
MKPTYEELEQQVLDQAVQLANAESKCRELAAESAALKQSKPSLKTMMSALDAFYADEDVPESAMLIAFNILRGDIETPTTEAVLAEVRAQGVDAAIAHLSKKFEGTGHIGVPVMALEWLSQEIRKGAAQ